MEQLSEIARLHAQRQRLQERLAQYEFLYGPLEDEAPIGALTARHLQVQRGIARLPTELLTLIFQWAVAPAFLITPAYASSPKAAWPVSVRTKHYLSLVCRSWHQVSAHLLYGDVGILSIGQIAAFLDTLQNSKRNHAFMVRSITVACNVMPHLTAVYREDLSMVLFLCRRLQSFSTCLGGPDNYWRIREPMHLCPVALPPCVVHLSVSDYPPLMVAEVLPLLTSTSRRLHSLHLDLTDSVDDAILKRNLVFENLTTFSFASKRVGLLEMIGRWEMPRVQNVTLSALRLPSAESEFSAFLSKIGHKVEYLHLHDAWSALSEGNQASLSECPRLSHLVLSSNMYPTLVQPIVQYVDVWEPMGYSGVRERHPTFWMTADELDAVFPALRNVRTLDFGLFHMPDLPRVLHPVMPAGSVAVFEHPGITVQQSADRLWRADTEYCDRRDADAGHEDGDYDLAAEGDAHATASNAHVEQREEEEQSQGQSDGESSSGEQDVASDDGSDYTPTTSLSEETDSVNSSDSFATEDSTAGGEGLTHDEVLRIFRRRAAPSECWRAA
ncbi:hypothetical protein HDZ31DRAFT_32852 [Schizophyllum fasciatum]